RPAHPAFLLHEGDQESAAEVAELPDPLEEAETGVAPPTVAVHSALPVVQCGDDPLPRQGADELRAWPGAGVDPPRPGVEPGQGVEELRARCCADDDPLRPGVEPGQCGVDVPDPAAGPYPGQRGHLLDQRGVAALAAGGVDVDDRNLADPGEALQDRERVTGLDGQGLTSDELHGTTADDVDRGDDHGRTSTPTADRWRFSSRTVVTPSWRIEATRTAEAPARTPSTRCPGSLAPPEAITGTRTADATASS